MEYGLIGEKLGHSFSKINHEMLADYTNELCPLAKDDLDAFMTAKQFKAINVPIPYKIDDIPYYDVLDGEPPSPTWGEADAQNYAMTMVCMPQSFEKWGLPDRLYTEVDFDLNKNADLSKVDQVWYQAFGKC